MEDISNILSNVEREIRSQKKIKANDHLLLTSIENFKRNSTNCLEKEKLSVIIYDIRTAIKYNSSEFQPITDRLLSHAQQTLYNNDLSVHQNFPIENTPGGDVTMSSPQDDKTLQKGDEAKLSPEKQVTNARDLPTNSLDLVQKLGYAKDAAYSCIKSTVDDKEMASIYFQFYRKLERLEAIAKQTTEKLRKT